MSRTTRHYCLAFAGGLMLASATLLASPTTAAADQCIARTGNTSWGQGWIQACARRNGNSSYKGWVKDKAADGHCVRWRLVYGHSRATFYTPWACPKGERTAFAKTRLGGAGSVQAYLERVRVSDVLSD